MSQDGVNSYLNKANHNQKLVAVLKDQGRDGFPDWVVIVMFYTGLHWLSAWLTRERCPKAGFSSHSATRSTIHYSPRFKPDTHIPVSKNAYNAYIELYDMSCTARYEGFLDEKAMKAFEMEEIAQSEEALVILKRFLEGKGMSL
ncbi:hypothetical protein [Hymenobacter guriensis]|uniref:HEPN domain-containing protein n=1 Tax=Hymenobacter guriensis TaxID=2793065 RepID=A0ABS0L7N3_9BACT|nr:hypothetical protein [Hymenobacter guriensis]MBG8556156.1 hypothetical protein [Hymenobacter guriensis]